MGNLRVLAATVAMGCATAPVVHPARALTAVEQIAAWEDRRSLGDGKLIEWARSATEPATRARALVALGREQRASTVPVVVRALSDPDASVRAAAAFAAGELGISWDPLDAAVKTQLAGAVHSQLEHESDGQTRGALIVALGQIATVETVDALRALLASSNTIERSEGALWMGVAQKRGAHLPEEAVVQLGALFNSELQPERYGAAYALAVSKSPAARESLLRCSKDSSSEIRAICVKGLAETAKDEDVAILRGLLADEDYRVVVEATRVLGKIADRCSGPSCPALEALGELRSSLEGLVTRDEANAAQPILALAQQGLKPNGRNLLASLRSKIATVRPGARAALQDDLANLDCRLAAALDAQTGMLEEVLHCGWERMPLPWREAMGLRELAQNKDLAKPELWQRVVRFLGDGNPLVRLAAIEALSDVKPREIAPRLRELLSDADPYVAVAAASVLADMKDPSALDAILRLAESAADKPDAVAPLADALGKLRGPKAEALLQRWLGSPQASVRIAAAKALSELSGKPVRAPEVELTNMAPARAAPKNATIAFRTEKGELVVKLDTESTPLTSGNLFGLARKGFFNGLPFHRIVPDFVVQGGDPHRDGEGGPGYTIRCEISTRRYVRGTVGMALSGKDTGGSQFFISTSPQPHLVGRYTAFGEVVSGMDVVDRLLENDKILEAIALY